MAYNMSIESDESFNWIKVNQLYKSIDANFSLFPIITALDENGLGLSIANNSFDKTVWAQASSFLQELSKLYSIKVFDLYEGLEIDVASYVPEGLV